MRLERPDFVDLLFGCLPIEGLVPPPLAVIVDQVKGIKVPLELGQIPEIRLDVLDMTSIHAGYLMRHGSDLVLALSQYPLM
jgi:hypothetical protein